jgi:hypothetical protein
VEADVNDPVSEFASFTPDVVGDYSLQLEISDGTDSDADTANVTVGAASTTDSGSCMGNAADGTVLTIATGDNDMVFDNFAWTLTQNDTRIFFVGFLEGQTQDACALVQENLSHAYDGDFYVYGALKEDEPLFESGSTIAWFEPPSSYPSQSDVDGWITFVDRALDTEAQSKSEGGSGSPGSLSLYTAEGEITVTDNTIAMDSSMSGSGGFAGCYCANADQILF